MDCTPLTPNPSPAEGRGEPDRTCALRVRAVKLTSCRVEAFMVVISCVRSVQ